MLAYLDEAGFSQVHPNRSACTPTGERHLIEAKRGKRLNVLAAMNDAVGTGITPRPPHRSVRAELPHTAPTLGDGDKLSPVRSIH